MDNYKNTLLNDKQRAFCELVVNGMNPTKAVIQAGYSEQSAPSTSTKMLRNPKIASHMTKLRESQVILFNLDRNKVLNLLTAVITTGVDDILDDWGELRSFDDLKANAPHVFKAIKEITIHDTKDKYGNITNTRTNLKLADRQTYLDMYNKIKGNYLEDNKQKGTIKIGFGSSDDDETD